VRRLKTPYKSRRQAVRSKRFQRVSANLS